MLRRMRIDECLEGAGHEIKVRKSGNSMTIAWLYYSREGCLERAGHEIKVREYGNSTAIV